MTAALHLLPLVTLGLLLVVLRRQLEQRRRLHIAAEDLTGRVQRLSLKVRKLGTITSELAVRQALICRIDPEARCTADYPLNMARRRSE